MRKVDIYINSRTCGGTSYLPRILRKVYEDEVSSVTVGVRFGAKQEQVIESITKQIFLLNATCTVPFTITVVRLPHDYD